MSRDKAYVHDIIEAFELAMSYLGSRSLDDLRLDQQKQDAIIRRIEVAGEAAKRLSQALRGSHPRVPWQEMAGMRDVLIHGYDRLDVERIHSTVAVRMPALIDELRRIRDSLPDPD